MLTIEKFYELKHKWKTETGGLSITYHKIKNENYQEIIAMGEQAILFILTDLKENGSEGWHEALHTLTKEQPVIKEHFGRLDEVALDWLKWGHEKGLISFDEKDKRIWDLEQGIDEAKTMISFLYNCLMFPDHWKHGYPNQTLSVLKQLEKLH